MFSQWRPRRQSGRRVMEQGTVNSDDMEYNILNINIRDTDVYNISGLYGVERPRTAIANGDRCN